MAFGFGFNKQKALSAAEKFVQQGKLQNAIAEYEKVLKADPKDLTVANTVGGSTVPSSTTTPMAAGPGFPRAPPSLCTITVWPS